MMILSPLELADTDEMPEIVRPSIMVVNDADVVGDSGCGGDASDSVIVSCRTIVEGSMLMLPRVVVKILVLGFH